MIHESIRRLLSRSLTVAVALLIVLSMMGAGVTFVDTAAAATTENATYYDDFEDGDTNGWVSDGTGPRISTESYWGNNSLEISDTDLSNTDDVITWDNGTTFNTANSFEISGTFNATEPGSADRRYRIGIGDDDSPNDGAVLVVSKEYDAIFLAEDWSDAPPNSTIDGVQWGTWLEYRIQFDGGDARAKVWAAGTDEPDEWQLKQQYDTFQGKFIASPGKSDDGRTLYLDEVDAGANAISGQVVDQNGDPVPNATVEAVGVDYDALNDSIADKQARSDELLEEAEDPLPDAWNADLQLTGSDGQFENADSSYVAAHTTDDWQLGGRQLPGTEVQADVNPKLDEPMLVAPNDEQIILTMWDPSDRGGAVLDREDAADSDLPGRTTSGTIVIEQISPSGEVVDKSTRDTKEYVTLNPTFSVNTKTHEAVSADLPNNHFYRVYPEGNEDSAYVIARGSPDDMSHALTQELTTEAGELDSRAQQLQNRIEDGKFKRVTTTTNETGHYEIRTLKGVQTASVQAYKADGELLTSMTGPSVDDLRTAHERGYNGSVYLSPGPERVDVPSENNTIKVYKSPTPPFGDMDSYEDILDYLENELLDDSTAILETLFEDELQNIDQDELEQRHDELQKLVENNEQLQNRIDELLDGGLSDGDKSRAELEEEISTMERSIADLVEELEAEDPDTEIESGEIHGTFPFAGELNEDAVTVLIHYQNGTSEVVSDEYWSVESSSVLGGDQVTVDGYPIPADTAVADIEVTGVSEDGRLGSSRGSTVNPAFDGDVPDVEAIDVSTLRPGADEPVSLAVRSDDSAFSGVDDVTVYGPDGSELTTTTDGDRVRFTPDRTGVHSVRVTYSNQGGTAFVESFRLNVKDYPTSDPPTVRVIDSLGGRTTIAGDKLDSASVRVDGDTADITAQAPGGESPSTLDVRAESLSVDTINLNVVSGSNEEAVSNHVSVRVYSDFDSEDTLVYRGSTSQPITDSSDTKYGTWETRENEDGDTHRVVETYTDANGEVTIDTSRDPGILERLRYSIAVRSPVELPSLETGLMTLHISNPFAGLGVGA